jgi:signal transduction histidine kinase
MAGGNAPIQRTLMRVILVTSGAVLLLTCSIYFAYEYYTFRQSTLRQLTTLGQIIAANSTAAVAFQSHDEAYEILSALKAEPHIVAAGIYDKDGKLFVAYPANVSPTEFPKQIKTMGYVFEESSLIGFQPVVQEDNHLGTLFLKSDMGAIYSRFRLFAGIAVSAILLSLVLAYILSERLQKKISQPIMALAETAKAISVRRDYSVRAEKIDGAGEFGLLTDAFNQMLTEIQVQNNEIQERNKEILSFNQRLEQNIIERTKELEAANKELEAFSYSVSHDLRSPLRSIDGYARILMEDYDKKLDDEGKRILHVIIKNAVRMGYLIDDLLSFSRIGKQSLVKVNLNLETMTLVVFDELRNNYGKNAELNLKPLLPARGDSSMLKQVITNLVSNALKYSMKKDKSCIEIGSYEQDGSHVYYVKDNGAGFDMRYYDKLFGVFQRLHSGNEFEGTGVGLALVQRIIHKHGGRVWAEGQVDVGATFYFSLPVS